MNILKKVDAKKTGIFAAGILFGTAGVKILASKDAKKVYTQCTAAVLRAKDCVMKKVTDIQENAGDIYAEACQINEAREEEAQVFEDESAEKESAEADADEANRVDKADKLDKADKSDKADMVEE